MFGPGLTAALVLGSGGCFLMDAEYDEKLDRIVALIADSEARIAEHLERLWRMILAESPVEDVKRTLDLSLQIVETMRFMLEGYLRLFRGRVH